MVIMHSLAQARMVFLTQPSQVLQKADRIILISRHDPAYTTSSHLTNCYLSQNA